MARRDHIVMIDHFDSFVHVLAEQFRRRGPAVDVYRSTWPIEEALDRLAGQRPRLVVLSPGPGRPRRDGLAMQLLAAAPPELPIFGVCLGQQCIVAHFGGAVERARRPVHGRFSRCRHDAVGLFRGLPDPLRVGRYHSLVCRRIPAELVVDARCDGEVMAVRHRRRPLWGVQFHPESILTPYGGRIIDNLLALTEAPHAA